MSTSLPENTERINTMATDLGNYSAVQRQLDEAAEAAARESAGLPARPPALIVYTIPADAQILSDGGKDGSRHLGYLRPGHYLRHKQLDPRGERICLVPCDDPGGLSWAWVRGEQVARFARTWGPQPQVTPKHDPLTVEV